MMDLDPVTGLPQLPAGYRFSVTHHYSMDYLGGAVGRYRDGYEVVLWKERRGLFGGQKWRSVDSERVYDPIESGGGDNGKFEVAKTLTDENIREAAERLAQREQERATVLAVEEKYLGTYPPKRLP